MEASSFDYLRSGDEKNFPWRLNPTADLLLLPNLQQRVHVPLCKEVSEHRGAILQVSGSAGSPGRQAGLHALRQRAGGRGFIELMLRGGQRSQHAH